MLVNFLQFWTLLDTEYLTVKIFSPVNVVQLFYYKRGRGDVFKVVEFCECKVNFSLLIDQAVNYNFLQHAHWNDETRKMCNKIDRSNNGHSTPLFILQLILRIFKLEFVSSLLLNVFLTFYELCILGNCVVIFNICVTDMTIP